MRSRPDRVALLAWGRWLADQEPFHDDYSFWLVETLEMLQCIPALRRHLEQPWWRKLTCLFRPFRQVYREDTLRLCALLELASP